MRKFLILFSFCMFQVNGMLTNPSSINSLSGCFRSFDSKVVLNLTMPLNQTIPLKRESSSSQVSADEIYKKIKKMKEKKYFNDSWSENKSRGYNVAGHFLYVTGIATYLFRDYIESRASEFDLKRKCTVDSTGSSIPDEKGKQQKSLLGCYLEYFSIASVGIGNSILAYKNFKTLNKMERME